ncbi:DnaD domain protein [Fundicoccus sp. Sow4_D5]|uniref:DnaD domain protein n=1 Tax=unclassified Fundicoccus TaxID=2761543 RepID=UPI003F92BB7D
MVVKRIVDTRFWEDSTVLDNYSVEDKYFLLYLMTNPRSSQVGIYSLPKRVISFDTGYTIEVINVLLDRFCNFYKNIMYSVETQEISLLNSLKYSIVKGGKPVSDLLIKELSRVQDANLLYATYENMFEFWTVSDRPFDKTVKQCFENELVKRQQVKPIDQQIFKTDFSLVDPVREEVMDYLTFSYFQANFGEMNDEMKNAYKKWIDYFGDDIVVSALQRSISSNNPYKYSLKILENWSVKKVKSITDIEKLDLKYSQKSSMSRSYTASESEALAKTCTEELMRQVTADRNRREQKRRS